MLHPINDWSLVKRLPTETHSTGGILLADASQEQADIGIVLETGPGNRNKRGDRVEMDHKPGDLIAFDKTAGHVVNIGGQELLMIREIEVLAVVEE